MFVSAGTVSQSVKEVLQSLADDNLVNTDKCGNQVVFWCLPSEASQKVCSSATSDIPRFQNESVYHTRTPNQCSSVSSHLLRLLSCALQRKAQLEQLQVDVKSRAEQEETLKRTVEELGHGREPSQERDQALAKIAETAARLETVDKELARFAEFDPEELDKLSQQTAVVREAANRWTDNIFNCQSWVCSKFGLEKNDFGRQFEIPEDLDYLEA